LHDALVPSEQVDDFIILRAIAFTSRVQRIVSHDVLRGEDLTVLEWRLLFSIARFGSCHLAHITRLTSIDPAHGSRAAASLEKKGYIERRDDPDNRRRKLISLTPAGMDVFDGIWPCARQAIKNITDHLSRDELEELKRLLDLVNAVAGPLADAQDRKKIETKEQLAS